MEGAQKPSTTSEKLQNFAFQASYLPRILRIMWMAAGKWTVVWAILLVVQGLLPAASLYLTRLLVDSLVIVIGGDTSTGAIQPLAISAVLMAIVYLLTLVLGSASSWVRTAQSELITDYLTAIIHDKAVALDLGYYETPAYHDQLYRARNDINNRPLALLENGGALVQNSITLVSIAIILIPYGFWIPLVLFLSTLPALFITVRYDRLYLDWWKQTTASRRWAQYYDTVLTHASIAAEVRLFGLGDYFKTNYQKLRERLRTERLSISRRQGLAQLGGGLLAGLMTLITLLWMLWQTVQGLFTLGDLALFYQAFDRGQRLMRSLLGNLGQIYSNTLFLGNLFEFLDLEPDVSDPEKPVPAPILLKEGICFRGVSFSYPGSERLVLQDFDFEIPAGKVVAIVGANGAGKTTLVKLICRFYDPEDGQIELDGCNIRNFAVADLRKQLTVMFQFPVTYVASAAENITYGDLSMPTAPSQVELAARRAGSHEVISRLPEGYKTMLGKWFDKGTELSGGEWQRIALARAFYRQAPIMILDEPTSQMDSWTEIDWFDRFRDLTQGRTALIITHRFTTAKRADIIHVMDQGRIVESGSHEELLIRDGLYAQSWQAQMRESVSQTDPMLEY